MVTCPAGTEPPTPGQPLVVEVRDTGEQDVAAITVAIGDTIVTPRDEHGSIGQTTVLVSGAGVALTCEVPIGRPNTTRGSRAGLGVATAGRDTPRRLLTP